MSRDPRLDPMPGDVLKRIAHRPRRVEIRIVFDRNDYPQKNSVWFRTMARPDTFQGITGWRMWAAKAEVLSIAEGPTTDGGSA